MRKKLILLAVAILLIFVGIVVFQAIAAQLKASAAKKLSDQFVTAVTSGDSTASYKLFTASAQKDTPSIAWQGTVSRLSDIFSGHQADFQSVETHPDYKLFTYDITGSDGKYRFNVIVVQQDKNWAIQSFTSVTRS